MPAVAELEERFRKRSDDMLSPDRIRKKLPGYEAEDESEGEDGRATGPVPLTPRFTLSEIDPDDSGKDPVGRDGWKGRTDSAQEVWLPALDEIAEERRLSSDGESGLPNGDFSCESDAFEDHAPTTTTITSPDTPTDLDMMISRSTKERRKQEGGVAKGAGQHPPQSGAEHVRKRLEKTDKALSLDSAFDNGLPSRVRSSPPAVRVNMESDSNFNILWVPKSGAGLPSSQKGVGRSTSDTHVALRPLQGELL